MYLVTGGWRRDGALQLLQSLGRVGVSRDFGIGLILLIDPLGHIQTGEDKADAASSCSSGQPRDERCNALDHTIAVPNVRWPLLRNIRDAVGRIILGNSDGPVPAAAAIRPLTAVGVAGRHARLVRIEIGFDGTFELPKFGLNETCMQEPADAPKLRAGMPAHIGLHGDELA